MQTRGSTSGRVGDGGGYALRLPRVRGGFTLVEILVSVAVILLLLGLILGVVRLASRTARNVQQQVTVTGLRDAVSQFKADFGFAPPLVREKFNLNPSAVPGDSGGLYNPSPSTEVEPGTGRNRIAVYRPQTAAADAAYLRGDALAPPADNPFFDPRFSERSLAYYLGGLCDVTLNATTNIDVRVDGVAGAGLFPPRADGSFSIPAKLLLPAAQRRNLSGRIVRPFVEVGRGDPRTFFGESQPQEFVELRTRTNVAYRYYFWLPAAVASGNTLQNQLADLRVPRLVGEDPATAPAQVPASRDLNTNINLRSARWAIVGPGRDGVFGDEPLSYLLEKGGYSLVASELIMRYEAAKDNVVEVGQ